MGKMKFDDLDALDNVAGEAALKAVEKEDEDATGERLVRGIPLKHLEILKKKRKPFATYARDSVEEKMKRDGFI